MKVTQWFDSNEKPIHKGVYQTFGEQPVVYQHWNGKYWGLLFNTVEGAVDFKNQRSRFQSVKWRGVA
jgi:hypothetical protein